MVFVPYSKLVSFEQPKFIPWAEKAGNCAGLFPCEEGNAFMQSTRLYGIGNRPGPSMSLELTDQQRLDIAYFI